jgi:hypothetical protein
MKTKLALPLTITDADIESAVSVLSVEANPHRLSLLPRVLREWAEVDLGEHAFTEALRGSDRQPAERCRGIAKKSKELLKAIDGLIEADQLDWIAYELGRANESVPMEERFPCIRQKLMEHRGFLNDLQLAAESIQNRLKKGPGQPRNTVAYLVLLDLAAIFKWLTGIEARRAVDRAEGLETGEFYHFCAEFWPLVFRNETSGLSAAMKNWASAHRNYNEASALIANIHLRHPSWRVLSP